MLSKKRRVIFKWLFDVIDTFDMNIVLQPEREIMLHMFNQLPKVTEMSLGPPKSSKRYPKTACQWPEWLVWGQSGLLVSLTGPRAV